ncbi:regulator of G-protein signaling 10 isoform X1 [Passer domesticus]|uniref:regulator of G-protein signaling 10 isoform X1 n=1 Tax=Passer domesticus TaxID=48849 RepID=UPI0030FE5167
MRARARRRFPRSAEGEPGSARACASALPHRNCRSYRARGIGARLFPLQADFEEFAFGEINDGEGHPSSSHQALKGTSKWATSLENLLEDPEGVKRFREFLKKEFSEENVLFWLACEEFKKTQGKKQMQEKAKEIYMTFLSSKASSQVNVEGQSRLSETILETPHPLMFQKLQDQIFNLMKYDSYSRFLKSDIFLNHQKSEEQEESSPEAQTAAKRASRIYNT